jgi:hypothetical protein
MRKPLTLLVAAFALAAVSFLATMLTSPPTTVAGPRGGIDVHSIDLRASQNLPDFEQQFSRHTGVLDTLP